MPKPYSLARSLSLIPLYILSHLPVLTSSYLTAPSDSRLIKAFYYPAKMLPESEKTGKGSDQQADTSQPPRQLQILLWQNRTDLLFDSSSLTVFFRNQTLVVPFLLKSYQNTYEKVIVQNLFHGKTSGKSD